MGDLVATLLHDARLTLELTLRDIDNTRLCDYEAEQC